MLLFEVLAVLVLLWFAWQLHRAKQFTQFKFWLEQEIKPKVIKSLQEELEETRNKQWPNNEHHQAASIYYWSQHQVRILQYALDKGILTKQGLQARKKWRHCQHLFHVQQQYLAPARIIRIEPEHQQDNIEN